MFVSNSLSNFEIGIQGIFILLDFRKIQIWKRKLSAGFRLSSICWMKSWITQEFLFVYWNKLIFISSNSF